ncbi:MAG TPA: winged helix-turn-helix domain-containing protein [Chthoniobacter sp.]|nr:winged helix-turn-helix domain-containing protein [Chthoniobacter sp.]
MEVDEGLRELRVAGNIVEIEPRPFDLLVLLLRRAGEVVMTEHIIASTWAGRMVNDASVTNVSNAISKLRRLLKDSNREIIRTVPKIGYCFSAPVERFDRPRRVQNTALGAGDIVPGRPNWQLTEKLDVGGFGDVWIARNAKTQEQRVFKFCSDEVRLSALKRESTLFRVLRETLGEHAPIPALLEWQFEIPPYYTEAERWGVDLSAWARNLGGLNQVPVDQRLDILALTADVLTTVHSVGVIHKDLKPQNILVQEQADLIQVRLCDFGTGFLLDSPAHEGLDITRIGFTHTVSHVGTQGYIAPELLAGGKPSIESDVYSLGVLLYQLVVGDWRHPAFGWEADIDDELLRQDIADCLHRDPSRRPRSALLVAQGIRSLPERRAERDRQRRDAQIRLELTRSVERARARRPWIIAASAAMIAAVLVSSWQLRRAQRAAAIAEENEAVAQSIADFLTQDIVRQASPDYGGKIDMPLKAAVLSSIPKINERVGKNVSAVAALSQSLAEALGTLSAPADAAKLAHEAADLYSRLYGPDDRRTLSAAVDEFSYRVLTEAAEALAPDFGPLNQKLTRLLPMSDPIRLKAVLVDSRLTMSQGRIEEAFGILEKAIAAAPEASIGQDTRTLDRLHLSYVKSLLYMKSLETGARYGEARDEAIRLMPGFEKTYGPMSRMVLDLHTHLGRALTAERSSEHDFIRGEQEIRIALVGLTQLYGAHSSERSMALADLGDLFMAAGRYAEAEKLERELLEDFLAQYGAESFWTWRTRFALLASILGQTIRDPSQMPRAEELALSTLAMLKGKQPQDGYVYPRVVIMCAAALASGRRLDIVEGLITELGAYLAKMSPDEGEHKLIEGEILYLQGRLSQARGQEGPAADFYARALALLIPVIGPDMVQTIDAKRRLDSLSRSP